MIEEIYNAPDYEVLRADAERLGFVDKDGNILVNGPTSDGGGYFLNMVGTVYTPTGELVEDEMGNMVPEMEAQPGVWGRLRVNGEGANLPEWSPDIIIYKWHPELGPEVKDSITKHAGAWSKDGVTVAPDWVGNIGVIA